MNTDIRIEIGFFDHPKTKKLERRLGCEAVTSLQRLWVYTAQYRPSGVLSGLDSDDLAIASNWNGEIDEFIEILVSLKFLDYAEDGKTLVVHDWVIHNSWAADAEKRSEHARNMNKKRWDKKSGSTKDTVKDSLKDNSADSLKDAVSNTPILSSPIPSLPNLSNPKEENIQDDKKTGKKHSSGVPVCPHKEIVELFHTILPELPEVRLWTDDRQKLLRTRWKEDPKRQNLDWWKRFFEYIKKSDFLTGRINPPEGRKRFYATLEWIVRPSNFIKVIEGNYEND